MDWFVIADLLGTIAAFAGGVLLAIPAFGDNFDRVLKQGVAAAIRKASPAEEPILSDADRAIEEAAIENWKKDRCLMRVGIVLIVVGLGLSVPVKVRDGFWPPDGKSTASQLLPDTPTA